MIILFNATFNNITLMRKAAIYAYVRGKVAHNLGAGCSIFHPAKFGHSVAQHALLRR
jgi:hypothetical protein